VTRLFGGREAILGGLARGFFVRAEVDDEIMAGGGQFQRNAAANAARSAGDQGDWIHGARIGGDEPKPTLNLRGAVGQIADLPVRGVSRLRPLSFIITTGLQEKARTVRSET
jgi:hypothetical protein